MYLKINFLKNVFTDVQSNAQIVVKLPEKKVWKKKVEEMCLITMYLLIQMYYYMLLLHRYEVYKCYFLFC